MATARSCRDRAARQEGSTENGVWENRVDVPRPRRGRHGRHGRHGRRVRHRSGGKRRDASPRRRGRKRQAAHACTCSIAGTSSWSTRFWRSSRWRRTRCRRGTWPCRAISSSIRKARWCGIPACPSPPTRRTPSRANWPRLGYAFGDITYLAMSHMHGDHAGNANAFKDSIWLAREAEREYAFSGETEGVGWGTPEIYSRSGEQRDDRDRGRR